MAAGTQTRQSALVVLGFAEALSAPEVAWSLVDAGFRVVAFSRRGRRAALGQSRHVVIHSITAPEIDCAASKDELSALLDLSRVDAQGRCILLPLDDASLWLCGQIPAAEGWVLAGARGDAAEVALDKGKQIRFARAAGFNVPESLLALTPGEVRKGVCRFPVILRPANAVTVRDGRLHKGKNWICSDETELNNAVEQWRGGGPLLVQPYHRGIGEGIFGLATGKGIEAWSAHRRLRMMNPHGSGSSACVSHPVSDDARLAVERFIQKTNWRGLFMVELLRDFSGTLWFVEFNGRPWGSMALSRRQGLEYPAWAVNFALNPDTRVDFQPAEQGRMVCRNAGRELMHLLFVLRGPKSKAIQDWPSFWRTAVQLLSVRRTDGLYNWRRDDPKVFFSDWWYTVRENLCKSRN
jgi:hypothetical protein